MVVNSSTVDYWKSSEKKFCDFCKCWLGGDKMTISLHENGKKHKDSVEKRLTEIHKKSAKDRKNAIKVDDEMRKMEEAALAAYMKDVEANADLTSQSINETLAKTNSKLVLGSLSKATKTESRVQNAVPTHKQPCQQKKSKQSNKFNKSKKSKRDDDPGIAKESLWFEAKSDEGHTYYWHIQTNESVWEAPEEGYMSLAEQEVITEDKKTKQEQASLASSRNLNEQCDSTDIEEYRSQQEREKLKDLKVEHIPEMPIRYCEIGPAKKANPYGKWTVIKKDLAPEIDLQLPQQHHVELNVIRLHKEAPPKEFKERQITSIDADDGDNSVFFKKRKLGCSTTHRRTARQSLDDELNPKSDQGIEFKEWPTLSTDVEDSNTEVSFKKINPIGTSKRRNARQSLVDDEENELT